MSDEYDPVAVEAEAEVTQRAKRMQSVDLNIQPISNSNHLAAEATLIRSELRAIRRLLEKLVAK